MTTISGAAQVNNIESASTMTPQDNPNSASALKKWKSILKTQVAR